MLSFHFYISMVDSKFTQNLSRINHLPWTPILNGPEYFELGVTIRELEMAITEIVTLG